MTEFKGHPDQHFGPFTFSQHGEDLMIANLFKLMGIPTPSFLDLGAHHPFIISNTALLYARGSRGVNVEANPNLVRNFESMRPEDKNVLAGIGLRPGTEKFYMYSDTSGRNTFSASEMMECRNKYNMVVQKTLEIDMLTVNQIVEAYCFGEWPDLLTMDIEGLDYPVLCSANISKSKPKIICVEVRRGDTDKFRRSLEPMGYFLHVRMGENLIFVASPYYPLVF